MFGVAWTVFVSVMHNVFNAVPSTKLPSAAPHRSGYSQVILDVWGTHRQDTLGMRRSAHAAYNLYLVFADLLALWLVNAIDVTKRIRSMPSIALTAASKSAKSTERAEVHPIGIDVLPKQRHFPVSCLRQLPDFVENHL